MAGDGRSLAGRTALVTGAAKRLGQAIALSLAHEGAHVVVHYMSSADAAEQTAERIRSAGVDSWVLEADLADSVAAEQLMTRAIDLAGSIDILVNSASIFPVGHLRNITPADIGLNIALHAVAPLLLSRAMAGQERQGHIINLLDSRITDYDRDHAAYHLSKRMLFTLTRMLALELAPRVAVNAVAPGLILPPPGQDEDYLLRMVHTNPLKRHGDAEDITDAVLFLAKSDFITGQVIFVDGGRHMNGSVYG